MVGIRNAAVFDLIRTFGLISPSPEYQCVIVAIYIRTVAYFSTDNEKFRASIMVTAMNNAEIRCS